MPGVMNERRLTERPMLLCATAVCLFVLVRADKGLPRAVAGTSTIHPNTTTIVFLSRSNRL